MKLKRIGCFLMAIVMFACSLTAVAAGYADVPASHWAKANIEWAAQEGLMNGVGGGNFDPEGTVNRAMLVTVLWRMEDSPGGNARAPFGDVESGQWYTTAIDWAYQNRIVNGTSATTFAPTATLTREQAAAVLYRYSEYAGKRVSARADLSIYPDAVKVSSWAKENLSWANAEGLITGTVSGNRTILDPQGNATRAQLATILKRYESKYPAVTPAPTPTPTPSIPADPTGIQDYSKNNPLLAETKKINTGTEVSFDIDTTGFVKNSIKIKDLKGKTLTLITALEQANFIYEGPNGEQLNEWTWFESLKKTYGLNVKYIESRFDKSPQQILTFMNAGKALDVIPTHRSAFPQWFNLSRALDPYIDLQYVDNSPGVDIRTLEQTKINDTYRAIGPRGAVDVIWYNESMVANYGMADPHKMWEQGNWNWSAWKSFQVAVPQKMKDGTTNLCPWAMSEGDAWTYWARTNGVNVFELGTISGNSYIKNNFEDPAALEAWSFYATTVKGVDYVNRGSSGYQQDDMYRNGSCIMSATAYLMNDYSSYDYAKGQTYNWVPYPKGTAKGATDVAMNYGVTMMLPRKMKNGSNAPYAVKFMELWATRFTEAMNDYLASSPFNFTYEQRMEYFDYAVKNNYFAVGTAVFNALTDNDLEEYKHFTWSFYNPIFDTATEAQQLYPLVDKAIQGIHTFNGGLVDYSGYVTVCSYNVGSLWYDADGVVENLHEIDADIVGVQELGFDQIDGSEQLQWLAEQLGYPYYYGITTGTDYQGILSRYPVRSLEEHTYTSYEGSKPRKYARAVLNVDGTDLVVYNTHLTTGTWDQTGMQYQELLSSVYQETAPTVVTGTFNLILLEQKKRLDTSKAFPLYGGYDMDTEAEGYRWENILVRNIDKFYWNAAEKIGTKIVVSPASDHNAIYSYIKIN